METDGGGWTVFLKRQEDKLLNFNRSWSEYKDGFGNPSGEYWLGTEYLHTITSNRDYALRLDLQAGTWQQSIWANFKVDDEVERNCLAHSNGRFFSTYDRDQDSVLDNCALQHGGGWWYYNCQHFNPTTSLNASGGFNISCYNKDFQTVQNLQLKIRPAMCSANVKAVYLNRYKCEGCHHAVQPLTIKGD
ncbi:ficolin-1-like [Homarus americanus]|uniref:ficolin-1-like n=1 Tax=Homarus americanus TaxID=6706 RepID=UPI001C4466F7|nr:ficolin-1-like [Homarus americanus]